MPRERTCGEVGTGEADEGARCRRPEPGGPLPGAPERPEWVRCNDAEAYKRAAQVSLPPPVRETAELLAELALEDDREGMSVFRTAAELAGRLGVTARTWRLRRAYLERHGFLHVLDGGFVRHYTGVRKEPSRLYLMLPRAIADEIAPHLAGIPLPPEAGTCAPGARRPLRKGVRNEHRRTSTRAVRLADPLRAREVGQSPAREPGRLGRPAHTAALGRPHLVAEFVERCCARHPEVRAALDKMVARDRFLAMADRLLWHYTPAGLAAAVVGDELRTARDLAAVVYRRLERLAGEIGWTAPTPAADGQARMARGEPAPRPQASIDPACAELFARLVADPTRPSHERGLPPQQAR